ncbi:MAG: hypothetical protein ABI411_10775 [Tahibacter sp.]
MRHCFAFIVLVLGFCGAGLAACPRMPTRAEWAKIPHDERQDALLEYSNARLLKCGWEDAEPAFRALFEEERRTAEPDGESESLFAILTMSPRVHVRNTLESAPDSEIAATRALALDASDAPTAEQRFETALPRLVELARHELLLSDEFDLLLESALVIQEVRIGQLSVARDHLARIEQAQSRAPASGSGKVSPEMREWLTDLDQALDLNSTPSASQRAATWVLDRRGRSAFRCGMIAYANVFDQSTLRAGAQAANHDIDAAIATLLQVDWRAQISGTGDRSDEILRLLHIRYSDAELAATLADAEASVQADRPAPTLQWFGQTLPLPTAINEDDPPGNRSGASRERPIDRNEMLNLLRKTPLYEALSAPATR